MKPVEQPEARPAAAAPTGRWLVAPPSSPPLVAALIAVAALAIALRLAGFDRPTHISFLAYYTDEPKMLSNALSILQGKPLAPHWPYALYYWLIPQISLYALTYAWDIVQFSHKILSVDALRNVVAMHLDAFMTLTRLNMLAFSLGLVLLAWLYARRCAGEWAAVAAALVVAVTPVMVNHARWAYYDTPMAFWYWTTAGVVAWTWQRRSWRGIYAGALLAAWTVTTKQNGLPIAMIWAVGTVLTLAARDGVAWHQAWRSRHFWLSGLAALLLGIACYPNLFQPGAVKQFMAIAGTSYVDTDGMAILRRVWVTLFTRHWPLQGPIWILLVLAAGHLPLLWLARDRSLAVAVSAATLGYYLIVGSSTQGGDRLILPLVPGLALGLVGWLLLVERLPWPRAGWALGAAVTAAVTLPLLASSIRFDLLITLADTRIQAYRWTVANLPTGAKIAQEALTARLPQAGTGPFPADYARAAGFPIYDVVPYLSLGARPARSYADQGFDYLISTDQMEQRARHDLAAGRTSYTFDDVLVQQGRNTYFKGVPLDRVAENYDQIEASYPRIALFQPNPLPPGESVDLLGQFRAAWELPLPELWQKHDELVLGPTVRINKVH